MNINVPVASISNAFSDNNMQSYDLDVVLSFWLTLIRINGVSIKYNYLL